MRSRFMHLWNTAALVIFFSAIFLGVESVFGFPAFTLAIFMWIVGGPISRALFGDRKKQRGRKGTGSVDPLVSSPPACTTCGASLESDSQFCSACGSAIKAPGKSVTY